MIRDSVSLFEDELGSSPELPKEVVGANGGKVPFDNFFGGTFVRRRLTKAIATPPEATSPKNAHQLKPALADYVWVAAEPLGGFILGQEVCLNAETDVQCGSHHATALRRGGWVKVDLIRAADADGYAARRRALFGAEAAGSREGILPGNMCSAREAEAADGGEKEVRTLWVDFDEHGDRYKRWRDVCRESYTPAFDQRPLEAPSTGLRLIKHAERHGGDPRLWLQLWMRSKHIEASDRTYHEMKVLTDALFYAGAFDHINIAALMSMEVVCRRIQAIVDAYSNPARPLWENAKIFAGQGTPEDIVSPTFRSYAAKKNKEELELLQARQKVRELRGGHAVVPEDGDVDDSMPQKLPAKPLPKRKGGKGGGGQVDSCGGRSGGPGSSRWVPFLEDGGGFVPCPFLHGLLTKQDAIGQFGSGEVEISASLMTAMRWSWP